MIKFLLLIFLALIPTCSQETTQTMKDNYLVGIWHEAGINEETGAIEKLRPRRGGFFGLEFQKGNQVIFRNPMDCGFGTARHGSYSIDLDKQIVSFHLTEQKGYNNSQDGDKIIDVKETYKLLSKEENAFSMRGPDPRNEGSEKDWAFMRSSE